MVISIIDIIIYRKNLNVALNFQYSIKRSRLIYIFRQTKRDHCYFSPTPDALLSFLFLSFSLFQPKGSHLLMAPYWWYYYNASQGVEVGMIWANQNLNWRSQEQSTLNLFKTETLTDTWKEFLEWRSGLTQTKQITPTPLSPGLLATNKPSYRVRTKCLTIRPWATLHHLTWWVPHPNPRLGCQERAPVLVINFRNYRSVFWSWRPLQGYFEAVCI